MSLVIRVQNSSSKGRYEIALLPAGGQVNGDWNVTDSRGYKDCKIILSGNLSIRDGGLFFHQKR